MKEDLQKIAISSMLYPHKSRGRTRPRRIETLLKHLSPQEKAKVAAIPFPPMKLPPKLAQGGLPPKPMPTPAPSAAPAPPKPMGPPKGMPSPAKPPSLGTLPKAEKAAPPPPVPPPPKAPMQAALIKKVFNKAQNEGSFKGFATKKTMNPEGKTMESMGIPGPLGQKAAALFKRAQVPPPPPLPTAPPPPAPMTPSTPDWLAPAGTGQVDPSLTQIPTAPPMPAPTAAPEAAAMPFAPMPTGTPQTYNPYGEAIYADVPAAEQPSNQSTWDKVKSTGLNYAGNVLALNPIGAGMGDPNQGYGESAAVGAGRGALIGSLGGPLGALAGAGVGAAAGAYKRWLEDKPYFSSRLGKGEVYTEDRPEEGRYAMRTGQQLEKEVAEGKFTAEKAQGDPMNPYWDYARSKGQVLGAGLSIPNGKRMPIPGEPAYAKMEQDMENYGKVSQGTIDSFPEDPNAMKTSALKVAHLRQLQLKMAGIQPTALAKTASSTDHERIRVIFKRAGLMEKDAQWWRSLWTGLRGGASAVAARQAARAAARQAAGGTAGLIGQGIRSGAGALASGIGGVARGTAKWGKRLAIGVPLAAGGLLYAATPGESAMPGTSFLGRAATTLGGGYLGYRAAEAAGLPGWAGALAGGTVVPGMLGGAMGGQGIGGLMQNPLVTGVGSYLLAKKFAPEGAMGMSPGMIGLLGGALGPSIGGAIGGGAPAPIYGGASG